MSVMLGDILQEVKDIIGRDDELDSVILAKIRQAISAIESNVDPGYRYMQKFYAVTLASNVANPNVLELPNDRVKSILLVTHTDELGNIHKIRQVAREDITRISDGVPKGYCLTEGNKLFFDSKPFIDLELDVSLIEKTEWSSDLKSTHWLFDNGEQALVNWVLTLMAPWIRDADMQQIAMAARDEGLKLLENDKFDMENNNTDNKMIYGG